MAECPTCGDTFKNNYGVKIHHTKAHGERISGAVLECENCQTDYRVKPSRADGSSFCSNKCAGEWKSENYKGENGPGWRGGKSTIACDWCGGDFSVTPAVADKRRFCSPNCYSNWASDAFSGEKNPNWRGGKANLVCEVCGADYTIDQRHADRSRCCSKECLGTWVSENLSGEDAYWWGSTGTDAAHWSGGTFPYGEGWNDRKKEAVRERDGRECQHCGRSEAEHLDKYGCKHHVHHIQKARSFIGTPHDPNDMRNLITLCLGECHSTWERMAPLRPQTIR